MSVQFPKNPSERQVAALKAVVATANKYPATISGEGTQGIGTLRALYRACGGDAKANHDTLRSFAFDAMKAYLVDDEKDDDETMLVGEKQDTSTEKQTTDDKRTNMTDNKSDHLAHQLAGILSQLGQSVDADEVARIVDDRMGDAIKRVRDEIDAAKEGVQRTVIEVHDKSKGTTVEIEGAHEVTPRVLSAVNANVNVMLVGPAGCGKTHVCSQVADALSLPFYMTGAIEDVFSLVGFVMPNGDLKRTDFREAFEHGGVFLLDELDACAPEVPVAFNAALANGFFAFPDGMVKKHENFVAIAATNTYGNGADRTYVGRFQLDGATLDRFATVDMDYDERLEARLAAAVANTSTTKGWVRKVQRVRAATRRHSIRMIVSMRASINGAALLDAGWDHEDVANAVLWKGVSTDERNLIEGEI